MGFERIVPDTDEWRRFYGNHIARYDFAVNRLKEIGVRRVLDAACGVGYGARRLADATAAEIVAVDRSTEALAVGEKSFAHPRVRFLQDDCHTLAAAGAHAPFDAVVSMETFEHLPKPMDLLASVRRCLKPGGTLLVSTPNAKVLSCAGSWEFHEKEYSPTEFRTMLRDAGFQNIQLFGQSLTERGRDREELRACLAAMQSNPMLRFGRWLQRTLRGRKPAEHFLPERAEDFEFVPMSEGDEQGDGMFVLLAECRAPG